MVDTGFKTESQERAAIDRSCYPVLQYRISEYIDFNYFARNIVSTVNLSCKLDLKQIALNARNAEYNPKVRLPDFEAHSPRIEICRRHHQTS